MLKCNSLAKITFIILLLFVVQKGTHNYPLAIFYRLKWNKPWGFCYHMCLIIMNRPVIRMESRLIPYKGC